MKSKLVLQFKESEIRQLDIRPADIIDQARRMAKAGGFQIDKWEKTTIPSASDGPLGIDWVVMFELSEKAQ